jgi:hypothetical protein
MLGNNLFGEDEPANGSSAALAKAFILPPFSVLNAREGWWQQRKRAWQALGIQSELGRGEVQGSLASARRAQLAAPGRAPLPAADYSRSHPRGDGVGKAHGKAAAVHCHPRAGKDTEEVQEAVGDEPVESWVTSSIFDPVLCEIVYRWFAPANGVVLDPFAGGSVRGIVASWCGLGYDGFDLRPEQCAANDAQAAALLSDNKPVWVCADSRTLGEEAPRGGVLYDLVFTCPPYGDLEVYSDDPRDLSNLTYDRFIEDYAAIIAGAAGLLAPNRFAAMVVGDFRDKAGMYRGFPSATIAAFAAAGMPLYNEAVLITAVGSLPVRTRKQFSASRKLGKTHQNLLVFVKGDPKKAAAACGVVDVG